MLVLGRKQGEKIKIGENIVVTVVEIQYGKIRLGIDAPKEIPVFRSELLASEFDTKIQDVSPVKLVTLDPDDESTTTVDEGDPVGVTDKEILSLPNRI